MTIDEGYIKFKLNHKDAEPPFHENLSELDSLRTWLHDYNMIGMLSSGIGFGNLSLRTQANEDFFIISGSGTGKERVLGVEGYALVEQADIQNNFVQSSGIVPASSESLTHAAIYLKQKKALCVVHIHHQELFDFLYNKGYKSISKEILFGTPELALALGLCAEEEINGLALALGHEPGLFFWGESMNKIKHNIEIIYKDLS